MKRDIEAGVSEALRKFSIAGVVSAYIFGSHAAGRAHRDSDIDIGVLLDPNVHATRQARFEVRVRLIGHLAHVLGTDAVDLVVLNDAPPHLVRRIMLEGHGVFCSDAEADHAAKRMALLRAADLEPFLRRTRLVKLKALAR